jgi:hypothetical protein
MRQFPAGGVGAVPRELLFNPFKQRYHVANSETLQSAIDRAVAGDTIFIEPGTYAEAITVIRAQSNLTLIGLGLRGSVIIQPAASNAVALTNEADGLQLVNINAVGNGTGSALINRGKRLRAVGCKFEGGGSVVKMTAGTDAQITALTHGDGSDCQIRDSEIGNGTKGIEIIATDHGAISFLRVIGCRFHDNTAADFEESGGTITTRFRGLEITECSFNRQSDGTEPTAYIILNDDNGNKGVVSRNSFPTALNGGKNLVSTGLIWTGNFHTAGLSNAQPS